MNRNAHTFEMMRSLASYLAADPKHTVLVVCAHKASLERMKAILRELALHAPALAEWEQRVRFDCAEDKPKFETLPKIDFDEWSPLERAFKHAEILTGADPEFLKRSK